MAQSIRQLPNWAHPQGSACFDSKLSHLVNQRGTRQSEPIGRSVLPSIARQLRLGRLFSCLIETSSFLRLPFAAGRSRQQGKLWRQVARMCRVDATKIRRLFEPKRSDEGVPQSRERFGRSLDHLSWKNSTSTSVTTSTAVPFTNVGAYCHCLTASIAAGASNGGPFSI